MSIKIALFFILIWSSICSAHYYHPVTYKEPDRFVTTADISLLVGFKSHDYDDILLNQSTSFGVVSNWLIGIDPAYRLAIDYISSNESDFTKKYSTDELNVGFRYYIGSSKYVIPVLGFGVNYLTGTISTSYSATANRFDAYGAWADIGLQFQLKYLIFGFHLLYSSATPEIVSTDPSPELGGLYYYFSAGFSF